MSNDNSKVTGSTSLQQIVIKCGEFEAGIVPSLGGCLSYFRQVNQEKEIDWFRPLIGTAKSPLESSCFSMAPFFSWMENDSFVFDGKKIQLEKCKDTGSSPMHGFAWRKNYHILSKSDDRIVLEVLIEDESWPWIHSVEQDISLTEKGLVWSLSVTNLSASDMPVGFGLHPFFENADNVTLQAQCSAMHTMSALSLPDGIDPLDNALREMLIGGSLPRDYDNVFQGFQGEVILSWPDKKLKMISSDIFSFLTLYSSNKNNFFCVEPVSHTTNAFNLKDTDWSETGFYTLTTGEKLQGKIYFYPM